MDRRAPCRGQARVPKLSVFRVASIVDFCHTRFGFKPRFSRARRGGRRRAAQQRNIYARILLRSRGVLATRLRLIYLADGQLLDYSPELDELLRFEKTLMAIWRAIQSAGATGDFRPNPSRLCDWCSHQALCPAYGGTPPPYPGWPENPAA